MGFVIKRDGKKQSFNGNKIIRSIEKACKDAGISSSRKEEMMTEVAEPVIKDYKNKRSIDSKYLREIILRRLDRKSKSVSNAWRRFDKKRRR